MAQHPALLLRAWPVALSGPRVHVLGTPPTRIPRHPSTHAASWLVSPLGSLTTPAPLDWHRFLLRPIPIPHSPFSAPGLPHLTLSSVPLLLTLLHAYTSFFPLFILPSFFPYSPTLHPSHSPIPSLPPLITHFPGNAPILPPPDPIFTGTCSVLLAYPST